MSRCRCGHPGIGCTCPSWVFDAPPSSEVRVVSRDEAVKAAAVSDDQLIDLYWRESGDDWAIPDWLMVKFGRAVLAAAEPVIERAVRAQAAAEVRARRDLVTDRTDAGRNVKRGMSTAARIVEGS